MLAIALIARLLLPAGYMPMPGQTVLTICTGMGPSTVVVDDPGLRRSGEGRTPMTGGDGAAGICDFAATGMLATGAVDAPQFFPAAAPKFSAFVPWLPVQQALRPPFLRPPLRAPPLS